MSAPPFVLYRNQMQLSLFADLVLVFIKTDVIENEVRRFAIWQETSDFRRKQQQ